MGRSKTSKQTLNAAQKRARAIELRKQGLTYAMIAADIGCSRTAAFKYVAKELQELRERCSADIEDLRRLELERLEEAHRLALGLATKGKSQAIKVRALNEVVKISARRSALLGLDSPQRHQIGGDPDSPPISIEDVATAKERGLAKAKGWRKGRRGGG